MFFKYLYREADGKCLSKSYSNSRVRPVLPFRGQIRSSARKPPKIERLHKPGQDIPITRPGCPGRISEEQGAWSREPETTGAAFFLPLFPAPCSPFLWRQTAVDRDHFARDICGRIA